jgi:hypothetical protein
MEKAKKPNKSVKTDWNDMENVAIKFHKMFKSSEKILEVVKQAKIAENSLADLKRQEDVIIGNLVVLRESKEDIEKANKYLEETQENQLKTIKTFGSEIAKLEKTLMSGCADKKTELDKALEDHAAICEESLKFKDEKFNVKVAEMDKILECKQKMIDSAQKTLDKLKAKLG